MPTPTPEQRKGQFQPLIDLLPKMEAARVAADAAVSAHEAQQAKVDDLFRKMHVLESKVQPYQGATPADFIAYGQVSQQYYAEYGKLADLRAAADGTYAIFTGAWQQGRLAYFALLENPGAVENTGGTPLS